MRYFIGVLCAFLPATLMAQYTTNGTATSLGSDCFRLTNATATQNGSVWANTPISLNNSFDIKGQIFLGCSNGGADGMTFTLQTTGTTTTGGNGGGLGYQGITNSVAVEFDTYQNATPQADPFFDHLALISGGSVNHTGPTSLAAPVSILPGNANAEDCQYHDVRFIWDPNNNLFEVYVDCQLRLTYNGDIRTALGGSTTAFYGFTGATGGLFNQQEACFLDDDQPGSAIAITLCPNDSLTLSAGPGSDHNWSPSAGLSTTTGQTVQAFPSVSTVYLVSYIDDCGFSLTDTFDFTVLPANPIPVDLGFDFTLCPLEDSLLDPGLPSSYTYTWQDGSTNPTLTAVGPGTYFVEVRDGCNVGRDTVVVGLGSIPTPTFFLQDSICVSELTNLSLTSSVISGATYNWDLDGATLLSGGPTTPQQLFWPTPGTKTVCLTVDQLGCVVGPICQTIEVKELPLVLIDPVADTCETGNSFDFNVVVVGDTPDVFQWNFGGSALPALGSGFDPGPVTYQTPGPKTVSLTVFRDGCQSAAPATVSFEVLTEPEAVFSPSSGEICAFEEVSFNYNGPPIAGQAYAWDFGSAAVPTSSTLPNPFAVRYLTPGKKAVTLTVQRGPCIATFTDTIIVQPSPIVNAGRDTFFCEGDGGVPLQGLASGGFGPLSYVWTCDRAPNCGFDSTGTLSPTVNPDVATPTEEVVFYFEAVDSAGCRSNLDSVVVTVKAKPRIDAGPDLSICPLPAPGGILQGGPAPTNTVPIVSWQWTPTSGLGSPTEPSTFARPDSTTIYTLRATAFNGCTSDATTLDTLSTAAVVVKDKLHPFAGPDTGICKGESIQLQAFASGAGPNYEYFWTGSPGGNLSDPTSPTTFASPSQTTIYRLVVSSNGCDSDGDDILVQVDAVPTVSPGNSRSACQFEPIQLDALSGGVIDADSNTTYTWSPAAGLSDPNVRKPIATPSQSTVYSVFATSQFGCVSDTQSVLLELKPTPLVNLLYQDTTVCEDDTLTLVANHTFSTAPTQQVNYRWLPTDFGYELLADSVVRFSPSRNGFVVVEAFTSSGDCGTRDSVFLEVNPAIKVEASILDTNQFCQGLSTRLLATGGVGNASFEWSPAAGLDDPTRNNPVATPAQSSTYVVRASEGACEAFDSVSLTVNPKPQLDFVYGRAVGCGDLEMSFEARTEFATALVWDFGDSSTLSNLPNPEHVYDSIGTYTVTLLGISEQGCVDSFSRGPIEVFPINLADFDSEPDTTAPILPTNPVIFSDSSTGAVAWLWDFGDGGMSTAANPTHRFNRPGEYAVTLTITDSIGCTYSVTKGLYEILSPDALLPTVFTPNGDGSNDVFRVTYGGEESFGLKIVDRWGREVFTASDPSDGWNGTLPDGSEAKAGVYFYTVNIGNGYFKRSLSLLR